MRFLFYFSFLIVVASCSNSDCHDLTQKVDLPNNSIVWTSDCYTHEVQQGIDTQVGQFVDKNGDAVFHYDIGFLASHYVDTSSVLAVKDFVANEPFWYRKRNNCNIGTGMDCYYVTIPENPPVNFIVPDADDWDDVIRIIRTYEKL